MQHECDERDGIAILRIFGSLDFTDSPVLLAELRRLGESAPGAILMNLAECHGICSSTIGLLVGWRAECGLAGREFWIVSPSAPVDELLKFVGMSQQLVNPKPGETEAVESVLKSLGRASGDSPSAIPA